jgi:hypothetical protein
MSAQVQSALVPVRASDSQFQDSMAFCFQVSCVMVQGSEEQEGGFRCEALELPIGPLTGVHLSIIEYSMWLSPCKPRQQNFLSTEQ